MADHNILSKCDQALVAYIISKGAGTTADTFTSKRSLDKELPCTIVRSLVADRCEEAPFTGTRNIEAQIIIRTAGISESVSENETGVPRTNADELVAKVWDCFNAYGDGEQSSESLAKDINAVAQGAGIAITFFSCEFLRETAGFEAQGDAWQDSLHLQLIAAPSVIS